MYLSLYIYIYICIYIYTNIWTYDRWKATVTTQDVALTPREKHIRSFFQNATNPRKKLAE